LFKLQVGDLNNVLRDLEVDTVNGFGVNAPQVDVSALQDALKGFLPGQPDATLTFTGPLSNKAAQAASGSGAFPAPSGVLNVLPALRLPANEFKPRTIAVYVGIQEVWTTGDPVWGVQRSATSGVLLFDFTVTIGADVKYSATFKFFPGSDAPAWGTAALSG
jgi:hypothetical protein